MAKKEDEAEKQVGDLHDVEAQFENIISTALMVPIRGNPNKASCHWGLPCIFWGLSGIGKSGRVEQAAQAVQLPYRVVYPATRQPEDFSGVVVPSGDGVKIECLLPAVRFLLKANRGLLFVDEASCAVPAVQGAMLSMIYERVVGDTDIPGGIRIMMAANPPEYAAGGFALEPPFANRIWHGKVGTPSVAKWGKWLMSEEDDPQTTSIDDAEMKVKTNWGLHWPAIKGALYSFMERNQALFHKQPPPESPQSGLAWPSPRTWYMAGRSMATVRCLGTPKELEQTFLEGLVGEGPATEFVGWLEKADLPNPKDVLEKGWKVDTKRLDRSVAVSTSMISYVLGIQDKNEKYVMAALAWNRLGDFADANLADIAMSPAQTLVARSLGRRGVPKALQKAAEPVIGRFGLSGMAEYAPE